MSVIAFIWKTDNGRHVVSRTLCLGRVHVGTVYYDSCRSKDDPHKHAAVTRLPGLLGDLGHFASEEDAMRKVEAATTHWLALAGLRSEGSK